MQQRAFFFTIVALFFIIALLPVLMMIADTFVNAKGIDFSAYKMLLHTPSLRQSFFNSVLLCSSVAVVTTVVGVVLGIVLGKTTLPYARVFILVLLIPLLIPPYIVAYGWFELLGREGVLGGLLFGFWGVFWVFFTIYLPIPVLLTVLFLKQINPRFEEVALLFTGWNGVLKKITLPLIIPAMVLSFMVVFILSFGEYSVPNFLRYDLFSLESFTAFSAFYDFKTATVLAMPTLLVTLFVVWAEQFFVHKHLFRFSSPYQIKLISLGKYQSTVLLVLSLFVLGIVVAPLSTLFVKAAHWQSFLLALDKGYTPMIRSFLYGFGGATLLVVLGFFSAYLIEKRLYGWWRLYDASIIFMFALSSIVVGIAMIVFWNRPSTNFIYLTPWIIIFGYLGKYLALSTKVVQHRLSQIPDTMQEAAQMAGANWLQRIWYIVMPLSKKALITAWLIGFIFLLRESTITMLVYPPGSDTLSVYIITQMANSDPKVVAGLCVMMIMMTFLPLMMFVQIRKDRND